MAKQEEKEAAAESVFQSFFKNSSCGTLQKIQRKAPAVETSFKKFSRSHQTFTCLKSTVQAAEKAVKYVQS